MELKIPPPFVMFLCALLAWLAAQMVPVLPLEMPFTLNRLCVIALATGGMWVISLSISRFQQLQTTTSPQQIKQATALVADGIYRFSRNPMYLGLLIMLIGWLFYVADVLEMVLAPAVFIAYLNRYQIMPEERALEQMFGDAYLAYKGQVRRWV